MVDSNVSIECPVSSFRVIQKVEAAGSSESVVAVRPISYNLKKLWHAGSVLPQDMFDVCTTLARQPVFYLSGIYGYQRRFKLSKNTVSACILVYCVKGKAIPLQAWRGWASRISRQSALEGDKVVSPTHQRSLPPGKIPGTHFC